MRMYLKMPWGAMVTAGIEAKGESASIYYNLYYHQSKVKCHSLAYRIKSKVCLALLPSWEVGRVGIFIYGLIKYNVFATHSPRSAHYAGQPLY